MTIISNVRSFSASEAREKLYALIKSASTGLTAFEINLRGSDPVILINKSELEAWQETFDILTNKKEIAAIRRAKKEKTTISHKQLLKTLEIKDAN